MATESLELGFANTIIFHSNKLENLMCANQSLGNAIDASIFCFHRKINHRYDLSLIFSPLMAKCSSKKNDSFVRQKTGTKRRFIKSL